MNANPALSFYEKERICEYNFIHNGPFWHLCTDGNNVPILFKDTHDMKFMMNLVCICARTVLKTTVLTFEIMNNHIHIIISGEEDGCRKFFELLKSKLKRYYIRNSRCVDLTKFECQLIPITDLDMLRNEIVYTNRNGFVVHKEHTPFSYPWGAGPYFFNPMAKLIPAIQFSNLSVKAKRVICKSHDIDFDATGLTIFDDMIIPSSFCDIKLAESLFRDAHHYFYMTSKNLEAFSETAKRLHESVFLTDEELYSAISLLCKKNYDTKQPSLLASKEKLEMARTMHYDYNATNRQIKSILKLEMNIIESLFPSANK